MKYKAWIKGMMPVVLFALFCFGMKYYFSYTIDLDLKTFPDELGEFISRGEDKKWTGDDIVVYENGVVIDNVEYYLFEADGVLRYVRLERNLFRKYRIDHVAGSGTYKCGIVGIGGKNYLLIGGINPEQRIREIVIQVDDYEYHYDISEQPEVYFLYQEIHDDVSSSLLNTDAMTLYDKEGNIITDQYDLSGGVYIQ